MCHYLEGIVRLCKLMKNLVIAEKTGNWRGHLQSVQDLLPVFRGCDSLNYLRYGSWYLEKMRMLETECTDIHKELEKSHFVAQRYCGGFTASSPDMHLEQTIQQSKKSVRGIVAQTKQELNGNRFTTKL